jgi:hypothetical protein
MNTELMKEYSDEEIKYALDGMGGLKAPGPDGMPALFYKRYWDVVGNDEVRAVKVRLNCGQMQEGWNDTVVVLIPKFPRPQKLKDVR